MISNYVSSDSEAGESFIVLIIVGIVHPAVTSHSVWVTRDRAWDQVHVWMLAFRYDAARNNIHIMSWWINNKRAKLCEGTFGTIQSGAKLFSYDALFIPRYAKLRRRAIIKGNSFARGNWEFWMSWDVWIDEGVELDHQRGFSMAALRRSIMLFHVSASILFLSALMSGMLIVTKRDTFTSIL